MRPTTGALIGVGVRPATGALIGVGVRPATGTSAGGTGVRGTSIATPEAGVRRLGIGVTGVGVRAIAGSFANRTCGSFDVGLSGGSTSEGAWIAGGRFTIGGGNVSSAAEGTPINLVAAISFCAIKGSVVG